MHRVGRKILGFAGLVLALGTFARPKTSEDKPPKSQAGAAAVLLSPAPDCTAADEGPWKALKEFRPFFKTAPTDAKPWGVPANVPQFLIAMVADPATTHLALDFDRTVESLILAAGSVSFPSTPVTPKSSGPSVSSLSPGLSGYSLQRRWTPWRTEAQKELPSLADRQCLEKKSEKLNDQPGLLVFQGWDEKWLLVFLVGESPSAGVNTAQWKNAVDAIHTLASNGSLDLPIGVVGPSFSGSLRSLALLLHEFPPGTFRFTSGMVTAEDEIRRFLSATSDLGVKYESTVESDTRATELFVDYVKRHWHSSRIAMLTEANTAYGGNASMVDAAGRVTLRYPREISRLRNAYQEETSAAAGPNEPAPPSPLTLKDTDADSSSADQKDGMPAFSHVQSPASQQAVLSAIANTIRHERIDFVGIVATDVLDALFLSRYLRSSCPDTRLFTLDADLLFAGRSEAESLQGLLAVTTYPLFSRNQDWTGMANLGRTQFASRYAEGVYNAAAHLLNPPAPLIEYTSPLTGGTQPPLWLAVMGRDGYRPLALLDRPQPKDAKASQLLDGERQPPPTLQTESPGRGWYLCFWLGSVLSVLHCSYARLLLRAHHKPAAVGEFYRILSAKLFTAYPRLNIAISTDQRVFLTAATLTMGCAVFTLAAPVWAFRDSTHWLNWTNCYCVIGSAIVLFHIHTAAALCWERSIWRLPHQRTYFHFPKPAYLTILLWVLAIGAVSVWGRLVTEQQSFTGYFLAYRSFSLTSGVAPELPLLLLAAALYGWALTQMKRVSRVEERKAFSESLPAEDYLPGHQLMQDVEEALDGLYSKTVWLPAIPFLCLWGMLFVPWQTLRTFESLRYDILLIAVLVTVAWATAVSWMQFLWCWNEFRVFLEWLETQPIRKAFSRLQKEVSWVPLVTNPPARALFISSRSLDCLKALRSFDVSTLNNPEKAVELSQALASECEEIEKDFDRITAQLKDEAEPNVYLHLQQKLQSAAAKIVSNLRDDWEKGDSDSLSAEQDKQTTKKKPKPDEALVILEEEFVALRYLMFIRYVFRNLRNLLGFIVMGFILSVVSLSSYSFQGHRWVGLASAISLLALGVGVVMVFAGMDRDAILSRITATKPNEVGVTFYLRVARFGALPILTLLASQFPSLNHMLFSWVQPALEALK